MTESGLFQNPFLDPYATLQGGVVAPVGAPLTPLDIPPIQTLVYKTGETQGGLSLVRVPAALSQTGAATLQPFVVRNEAVGIELSLAALGAPTAAPVGGIPLPSTVQALPANMREAREVLTMISAQRTGSKSRVFGISELKQIARNLNLPSTGNKDELASRLRTAIIDYFNLPAQ